MAVALASIIASFALADDVEVADEGEAASSEYTYTPKSEFQMRAALEYMPGRPAISTGVKLAGPKDAYLNGDLRLLPGFWTTRVGAGFDVFGRSPFDLTFGLFVGAAGYQVTVEHYEHFGVAGSGAVMIDNEVRAAAGSQIGIALELARLYGSYRWLFAWAPSHWAEDVLSEQELRVGYKFLGKTSLYGEYVRMDLGGCCGLGAIGLGIQTAI